MKSTLSSPVRLRSTIEVLELRIAPAAVFTFTDVDGDDVTIRTSKGTNADLAGILFFDDPNPANPRQLQEIDFSIAAAIFAGTDLSITAKRTAAGGDGYVNVGEIDAADFDGGTALDLGRVSIKGDLGRILVGDADPATGLKSLTLQSLGEAGIFTQATGGVFPASLNSAITGNLGSVKIAGSVVGAAIGALNDIGSVTIGGSIFGDATAGSGGIVSLGKIGPVKVGGSIVGGDGDNTGRIATSGSIASLTIGGSLVGGGGTKSGFVMADQIGMVKIGGSILGGSGTESGRIVATGDLASLTLGGSLAGGRGDSSGSVAVTNLGSLKIARDVRGDSLNSGQVLAFSIGSVAIGGSILSGFSDFSGEIHVVGTSLGTVKVGGDLRKEGTAAGGGIYSDGGNIGKVTIRGGILGTSKVAAGGFAAFVGPVFVGGNVEGGIGGGRILGVTIGGSLIGGTTASTGLLIAFTSLGPVKIGGDIVGGTTDLSGSIGSNGSLASVQVGGSVIGGTAPGSGAIRAAADAGPVVVRGDLRGGSGMESGRIDMVNAASIFIGGSVIGGTADDTGAIEAGGTIKSLKLGGDLRSGPRPLAGTVNHSGFITADNLPSVTIGGSILAATNAEVGTVVDGASIRAAHSIGTFTVLGDIVGHQLGVVTISASGQATPGTSTDVAIGSLTVKGRVERANILAGVDINGVPDNADAQIGRITAGHWIASNAVAGITSTDAFFGDLNDSATTVSDDPGITSRIGSIVIKGQLAGTASDTDASTFGFGAQQLGSIKIGATVIPLTPGAGNDTFAAGAAVRLGATKGVFLADGFDFHAYEV